jgi:hypothetical protein
MKSTWQIEPAEEENSRNQHDEMTARTLGCSKILDIAFMSRKNKHSDFFPIGSLTHFAGSLLVMPKSLQLEHVQKVFANHVSSFRRTAMTLGVTTEHESLRSSFPHALRLKPAGTSFGGNPDSFKSLDPRLRTLASTYGLSRWY